MTNKETAKAFYNGYGEGIQGTQNMIIEDINGVLIVYSYGEHFPISIKFNDGFLFTKSSYSNTTARHKSLIKNEMHDGDLNDSDYMTTSELKQVVDDVKYNGVRSKAELIEHKI